MLNSVKLNLKDVKFPSFMQILLDNELEDGTILNKENGESLSIFAAQNNYEYMTLLIENQKSKEWFEIFLELDEINESTIMIVTGIEFSKIPVSDIINLINLME